jgi:hypothetical protein
LSLELAIHRYGPAPSDKVARPISRHGRRGVLTGGFALLGFVRPGFDLGRELVRLAGERRKFLGEATKWNGERG